MRKTYAVTSKNSSNSIVTDIVSLTLSDEGNSFHLEFTTSNQQAALSLKKKIFGMIRIHDMETGQEIPCVIEAYENVVKVTGNIYNLLYLIADRGVISETLLSQIIQDKELKSFLELSQQFKLSLLDNYDKKSHLISEDVANLGLFSSENPKLGQEVSSEKIEKINQLESQLVDEYKDLTLEDILTELNKFSKLLSEKRGIEVRFTTNVNYPPEFKV